MTNKIRPYPHGIAWDEALLQRERADAAEAKLNALREAVAWLLEVSDTDYPIVSYATKTSALRGMAASESMTGIRSEARKAVEALL